MSLAPDDAKAATIRVQKKSNNTFFPISSGVRRVDFSFKRRQGSINRNAEDPTNSSVEPGRRGERERRCNRRMNLVTD
ncbi:hypothetical protein TNCV_4429511 [Trichonephila clavipes]|nr:hypothetical protein TNCV_4429511 [Trichonephila clavipes]